MEFTKSELKQLRPRGANTMYNSHITTSYVDEVVYIEKDISKGDTLLSFSIKFNCNVS